MLENIKSVLVGLTKEYGSEEPSAALGYGLSLAQETGAHLTIQAAAQHLHLTSTWVVQFARDLVAAENTRLHRLAQAAAEKTAADASAAGVVASAHAPQLAYPNLLASFTALAHVHDLSVIDAEPEPIHPDRHLIEALLVASGRPLLVVPSDLETFRMLRILVAWDGSGRAARAVHDGLPFLRAAQAVQVITVTGEKELPLSSDGSDLATHLARHGVKADLLRHTAQGGDVARSLRDAVQELPADLLVMGGYVHSRLRELVFGGVTQSLLRSSPVPLLMSH